MYVRNGYDGDSETALKRWISTEVRYFCYIIIILLLLFFCPGTLFPGS